MSQVVTLDPNPSGVVDKHRENIDLEHVFAEFKNWAAKTNSEISGLSGSCRHDVKELVEVQSQLKELLHRIHDVRELTFCRDKGFKWLNPLRRAFRRKSLDRSLCDLHELTISVIRQSLELMEAGRRQAFALQQRHDERLSQAVQNIQSIVQNGLSSSMR